MIKYFLFKSFPDYIKGYGIVGGFYDKQELQDFIYNNNLERTNWTLIEKFIPNGEIHSSGTKSPTLQQRLTGCYLEYIEIPKGTLEFWIEVRYNEQ